MYSWQRCAFDSAWLYMKPHTQQNGEKNSVKSPMSFYFKKELGLAWTIPTGARKMLGFRIQLCFSHGKCGREKERERKGVKGRRIFLVSEYMVQVKD